MQEITIINLTFQIPETAPKAQISPKKKTPKKIFQYGNYPGYYSKRNGVDSYTADIRLEMLITHQELLNGKKILDIGCNDGLFTLSLVKKYCPKSMHGLDIDGDLISEYFINSYLNLK